MISRLSSTSVYVADQQEALKFWTEKIGFELHADVPMGEAGRWMEVGPAGATSFIVLYPRGATDEWKEHKTSVVFHCENAQTTYEELAARGVTFVQQPTPMPWGNFAAFIDPDGNWFGLTDAK